MAVRDGETSLTYRDLERRANGLAQHLQRLGVGPGVLVGLCQDRSAAAVVGALAVLEAGGAYLGLDPSYPDSALEYMLNDSGATVLLGRAPVTDRLPSIHCEVLDLDACDELTLESPRPPRGGATASDIAYVVYTSGSTGTPKGVAVSHASLSNLVHWHTQTFGVSPGDRASLVASPAFDASVWELWPYLVSGASLHVADPETPRVPHALLRWMVDQGITIGFAPTPTAEALLGLEWPSASALRVMLTGADVLHRRPAHGTPFVLVNNYGVTEATVVSTSGTVAQGDPDGTLPSIGRPIPNVYLRLVDESGTPVSPGTPGELYIGGPSVALGYVNHPELTAERFVAGDPDLPGDPDDGSAGRWYRTGDLVKLAEDGEVEFLGRLDQQVSIRGHRIEPEEINVALAAHPEVAQCAVVPMADDEGATRLVAYVVPSADGAAPSAQDLRAHLSMRLPRHMIPSAYVEIPILPVTLNGKLDRDALPRPGRISSSSAGSAGPRTATELVIVGILRDLLGPVEIGRDDNFFELGGHSLMAAQLIARVHEQIGVELSLLTIFDHPTLSGIASLIDEMTSSAAPWNTEERHIVQVRPGSHPALFCIVPDDGSLVATRQFLSAIDPGQAIYGLVAPYFRSGDTSVDELAEQLLGETFRTQPEGPYLITGYSLGGLIAYALAERLSSLGHDVSFLGLIDTTTPDERSREATLRSRIGAVLRGGIVPAAREGFRVATLKAKCSVAARLLRIPFFRVPGAPGPASQPVLSVAEILERLSRGYRPTGHRSKLVVFVAVSRKRHLWPRCLQQTRPEAVTCARPGRDARRDQRMRDITLGWSRVHRGPLRTVLVPGDHHTVMAAPNVTELAVSLARAIEESADVLRSSRPTALSAAG